MSSFSNRNDPYTASHNDPKCSSPITLQGFLIRNISRRKLWSNLKFNMLGVVKEGEEISRVYFFWNVGVRCTQVCAKLPVNKVSSFLQNFIIILIVFDFNVEQEFVWWLVTYLLSANLMLDKILLGQIKSRVLCLVMFEEGIKASFWILTHIQTCNRKPKVHILNRCSYISNG